MHWTTRLKPLSEEFKSLASISPPGYVEESVLAIRWGEAGFSHRKARILFVSTLIGREIKTFKDLFADEATALGAMLDSASLVNLLVCYYQAKEEWVAGGMVKVRPRKPKREDENKQAD
mgnify:FL=1